MTKIKSGAAPPGTRPEAGRRRAAAKPRLPREVTLAVEAAESKKASAIVALDLRKAGAFTDYFLICSGQNARQVKAIVDAIEESLGEVRVKPTLVEGYDRSEWVLMDFFTFIVHVFTPDSRTFYDLERLWGSAERILLSSPEA
jgi:ribosome-associated protein